MATYNGKCVYNAIAVGKVTVYKRQEISVNRTKIENIENEIQRLENAKASAIEQLRKIYKKALKVVGEANAQIFEIHMMMVEDYDYNDAILEMIKSQRINAEYAVLVTAKNFADMFAAMNDSYMRAREADIYDISNRIIACLTNKEIVNNITDEKQIICVDDLFPSETVCFDKDKVLAIVTACGSPNSHTAILARNMNIPLLIGVGEEFLNTVKDGDIAIVNGFTGEFILNPDDETVKSAVQKRNEENERRGFCKNSKLIRYPFQPLLC